MIETDMQTLLIVEDEPRDIKALGLILENEKYNLVFKQSGPEALDFLAENKPDLILLDIMFEGMDGFEICRRIKAQKSLQDIPVVFLTARYDYKDVVTGFELGAVDYITKPFNPLELVSRIKAHLSLRETKLQLERINKTKDKLFSILSHDLRNPLISIQSGLKMLYDRTGEKNEEWMKLYIHMVNISSSTFHLLNSILDWSKTQMTEFVPQPRHVYLENFVAEVVKLFRGTAELNDLKLEYSAQPVNVFIDKEMLSVILRNLVANAVKFTLPGGTIKVDCGVENGSLYMQVVDTGVGMSQEQLSQILPITEKHEMDFVSDFGAGLGLSICQEMAGKLGGIIEAESEPDKGTTMTVKLPAHLKTG